MDLSQVSSVSFRTSTESDAYMRAYDYSTLNAIAQCPTWGTIRYVRELDFSAGARSMALEAGAALHDGFAAIRLADVYQETDDGELFDKHLMRLFNNVPERVERLLHYWNSGEDWNTRVLNFAIEALNTSGFYDDPRDKRRTMSNLEECLIAYYDRWASNRGRGSRIWVRNDSIGVEVPFDIHITFARKDGEPPLEVRYIGKMDGLHETTHDGNTRVIVHENKTAARIDESWLAGMKMSHQITGYTVAASLFTHEPVSDAYVHGLSIPLPKDYDYGGVVREKVTRGSRAVYDWLNWILHAVTLANSCEDVYDLPRYTHSCNRYFRPCPFMPLCHIEDREEFHRTMRDMVINHWNPLDD